MKIRGPLLLFALLALATFAAAVLPDNIPPGDKPSVIVQTMMRNLERFHYRPMQLDDDFSQRAYEYYLDDTDGARLFFTQEDIDAFSPYADQIDDQVNAGTYEFFDLVQEHWVAAITKTKGYYEKALSQPFDLKKGGEVTLRGEDADWTKDDKELEQYWRDYIKRDILNQIVNELEDQENDEDAEEKKTVAEIEADVRQKTLKRYDKWYERMQKAKLSIRRSQYLNALTAQFDPHTSYYRPKDKESFDIRFSGQLEGIGATLQNDDSYTKVSTIVVGGPAWKAGELEVDDLIMAVRQGGEEKVLDIKDMLVEDVVQHIRGDKGTTVHLKIKKPDGTIKEISIVRDVVIIDESYAKSLIVDGKGESETIGYLNLPSFYANFNDRNGRFSAKDVKAELQKLQDNDVEGIILDLRNNGGGSLRDVVDMTGFFIPEGPVVQVAGRGGQKEVLRDKDDRVFYDGPLIVLVNQQSASASEILAAALQDYGRAVIVGSTSTFGKGTVQRFIDLDRTVPGLNEVKPLGTVKLTMQKFYRINGGSTQLRGVTPDIVLPDSRALLETGERQQTAPLPWSEIEPAEYYQDVYRIDFMDNLRERSNNRVVQNPTFQRIQENAKRVKRQRDKDTYPLTLAAYQAMRDVEREEAKQYKDLYDQVVITNVTNIDVDLEEIENNESKKDRNTDFKEGVGKDVYIEEALNILADMKELRK
ncbi:MAG: carboxy terminal-processing peptidase [Bacteroidota bacterium]